MSVWYNISSCPMLKTVYALSQIWTNLNVSLYNLLLQGGSSTASKPKSKVSA
jgi:hypothetical protein